MTFIKISLALGITLALTACGGGGGSDSTSVGSSTSPTGSTTTPTSPTAPSGGSTTPTTPTDPTTPTGSTTPSGYGYFADIKSQILKYEIDASGALTSNSATPVYTGKNITAFKFDPSGKFAYAVSDAIYQFKVGEKGALQLLATTSFDSKFTTRSPTLVIDPKGKFLLVGHVGTGNTVSQYAIGASGALTLTKSIELANQGEMTLDPSGQHLFIVPLNYSANAAITEYSIGADGVLLASPIANALLPIITTALPSAQYRLILDPSDNFAYLSNCPANLLTSCEGYTYKIGINGTLGARGAARSFPAVVSVSTVVDAAGRYAYVLGAGSGQQSAISVYRLGLDGSFNLIATVPNVNGTDMFIDSSNKNLYVGNFGTVTQFAIGEDGKLTQRSQFLGATDVSSPLIGATLLAISK